MNQADKHYSGIYTDSGVNSGTVCDPFNNCSFGRYHLFTANTQTTGPSPSIGNQFNVAPFELATVYLSWNDPPNASTNDYDLVIYDCFNGFVYSVSSQVQNGFQEPQESAPVTNFLGVSYPFCYAIINFANLAAPRTLNVIIDGITPPPVGCLPSPAQHMFNTLSMSLVAPADTPGDLIAVGAVPQCSPNQIEVFSSRGPTFDGRTKPDVVAVDGVAVTGAGGFPTAFFGTSAAAPHVAGLAALLLQINPGLSRSQLKSVLQQSAVPLGPVNTFGSGRVNGVPAANAALALRPMVFASILPASRSVTVGTPATAFATIIASGATTATACGISLLSNIPAAFQYWATDPVTNQIIGPVNTPVSIAANAGQSFVFAITPTASFAPTEVQLGFDCTNTDPASIILGLNTLLLSASAGPVPDIVALGATVNRNGIVDIPGTNGTGFFSVATVNVGATGQIAASADTGAASLPVGITLCQTNPTTGVCLATPGTSVTTQINANDTPTFAVFVQGHGTVPFDPANNRVFVRFKDGGVTRGATSVAVRTQ